MKLTRRDFRRGDLLTVHKKDGETVQGSFLRATKRYIVLERYSIEAGGVLVQMKGDELHVPVGNVGLVESSKP